METPEWDIFDRLEKVEKLRPALADAAKLGTAGFLLSFIYMAGKYPSKARKLKDMVITWLKQAELSTKALDLIEKRLIIICEEVEKQK